MNRYQSTPGSQDGAFPTEDWFSAIRETVSFVDRTVLDVGCSEGVMSALALEAGASFVSAIDASESKVEAAKRTLSRFPEHKWAATECRAEDLGYMTSADVVIASMVLHWTENPAEIVNRLASFANRKLVVIFRSDNEGYLPSHGNWFPTLNELMHEVGHPLLDYQELMEQDSGKLICLAVFWTNFTKVYNEDDSSYWVSKGCQISAEASERLAVWLTKAGLAEDVYVHSDGYTKREILGWSLDGAFSFLHRKKMDPVITSMPLVKDRLRFLLARMIKASIETGWYLPDLTLRNLMYDAELEEGYPIDFEDFRPLVDGRVEDRYLPIWKNTLSYADIDEFDGDLKATMRAILGV